MKKIAMIGAGSMAEALLSGMVRKNIIGKDRIWVTNRSNREKLESIKNTYGVNISYDRKEIVEHADIVILAMKPKDAAEAMEEIRHYLTHRTMIVSLLAGITIDTIERLAGKSIPVVRVMPNTSAAIGQSATAIAFNNQVDEKQKAIVKMMFDTVGLTVFVNEDQLDAVTGLSGSGPAYIYYLIEAMEKSAVEIGLDRSLAKKLIVQTLIGAAGMVAQTNKEPAMLRKDVTSPGGTTEAGLKVLQAKGVQEAFIHCIKEATNQSKRLGYSLTAEINEKMTGTGF